MNKKTLRNTIVLSLVAVVLVVTTVFTTLAYLSGSAMVTNTFSVGDVGIKMDESAVDENGVRTGEPRRAINTYKLQPGLTYVKDPIVHIEAKSVDSYLFVVVQNDIATFEDASNTIEKQMSAKGWKLYTPKTNYVPAGNKKVYVYAGEGNTDAYAKVIPYSETATDVPVFDNFSIAPTANVAVDTNTKVELVAYAIQSAGLGGATAAETTDNAWQQLYTTFNN